MLFRFSSKPSLLGAFRNASFISTSTPCFSKQDLLKKIKELRILTSAPLIDCKSALEETDGDLDVAKSLLIKKGLAQMEKMQSRSAEQGSIWVVGNFERAAIMEMNCQTDFVSTNEAFKSALNQCATSFLKQSVQGGEWITEQIGQKASFRSANIDWIKTLQLESQQETIGDAVATLNYTTGEKVEISRASIVESQNATFGSYIHQGRIGTVVSMTPTPEASEKMQLFAKNLAIHVAGFRPQVIGVPSANTSTASDNAPYQDAETLGEVVPESLMEQPFSIMGGGSVGQRLLQFQKESGLPIAIDSFVWWEIGGGEISNGF